MVSLLVMIPQYISFRAGGSILRMMMFQLMKLPENSVGYGLEQWGRLILMDTLLLQTELLFGNAEG